MRGYWCRSLGDRVSNSSRSLSRIGVLHKEYNMVIAIVRDVVPLLANRKAVSSSRTRSTVRP